MKEKHMNFDFVDNIFRIQRELNVASCLISL